MAKLTDTQIEAIKKLGDCSVTGNGTTQIRTQDGAVINIGTNKNYWIQGKKEAKEKAQQIINDIINNAQQPAQQEDKQLFIVYGHDHTSREQLEFILTKLGVKHTKVTNNTGMTIIEALEGKISQIHAGIVLLTPDDYAIAKSDFERCKANNENYELLCSTRARQNVILEMGMLLAGLGRENVIVLRKEDTEIPSDISGVFYISYKEHVKETVKQLVERLKKIGFDVDMEKLLEVL